MPHIPSRISKIFGLQKKRAAAVEGVDQGDSTTSAGARSHAAATTEDASPDLCLLEALPLELKIHILASTSDFAALRAIVHASPMYHQAYLAGKLEILSVLVQTMGVPGTEVDALGALLSLDYADGMQDYPDEVIAFLDRYRHARGAGQWTETKNPPLPIRWREPQTNVDDLMTMIRFHELAEHLEIRFLEYVGESDRGSKLYNMDGQITLSLQERMRIHRAIYRLQIFCHLFGMAESTSRMQTDRLFQADDWEEPMEKTIGALFLTTFTPWEQDEMKAIWHYVETRSEDLINKLVADPKKDARNIVPDGYYYSLTLESITCAGPLLLAKALRQETFEHQYAVVADIFGEAMRGISNIGLGPIESSFENATSQLILPYKPLYPADKFACFTTLADGTLDLSSIPWHEQPSAGFKWLYPKFGRHLFMDESEQDDAEFSDHEDDFDDYPERGMLQPHKLEDSSGSYVFWDREKLIQTGVLKAHGSE